MGKYGFLGIGIMGRAMATNLLKAGFDVTVWNRSAEKCAPLVDLGAKNGKTAADVVAHCDITFAMVSDPGAANTLCFGKNGVLEGISAGKSYVDVSTVDAGTAILIHDAIKKKGGRYLEAPVSGSKKPAEDGALVFLCSGDESLYKDAGEALDVMGKKSFYFPQIGQGAQMKLVINMIMGTMMTAFAEGLSLGDKIGLKKTAILDVIAQGAINSPMFQLKGPSMTVGDFTTAFPLKHMQKDMRLALLLGDSYCQPLYTSSAANNAYITARKNGCSDEDFSAVIKNIEK
ncbi:putative oxidoreductase family protein [Desulforapulum autotrophicum HRM2]|uniref:Oxidoreductase family protein n=2 Tax=Desulforapulum autotrophicum TaxID=2296 RepID=C0QJG1_DESAH|nr:putative oxidoreductase family protein [Desulforapulum autotrophicum HRM2]